MDLNFVGQVFLKMLPALPRTLSITVLPFVAALFLGLLVTLPIVCNIPILKPLCKVYVSFFRGTPFIGQLFMIYFGLPRMFACLSAMDKIEGFALTMVCPGRVRRVSWSRRVRNAPAGSGRRSRPRTGRTGGTRR